MSQLADMLGITPRSGRARRGSDLDPEIIREEDVLAEGLRLDEREFYPLEEDHGGGHVAVMEDRHRRPGPRRRRSSGELLEALGLPADAAAHEPEDVEAAWDERWQAEFGTPAATERAREDVARVGLAEALRERAEPRRRRRGRSTAGLLEALGYEPAAPAYGAARLRQLREEERPAAHPLRPPPTSLEELYARLPRRRRRG